nr:immunoglobulin heavy chain junction region [Mus musculus]
CARWGLPYWYFDVW